MKKNLITMIDDSNNSHYVTFQTPRRFFEIYGGNSVLIIGGKYAGYFIRRADGKIFKTDLNY